MRIAIPEIGQDVTNYINAVLGTAGEPVVISAGQAKGREVRQPAYKDIRDFRMEDFDGLLLPGGSDIDPARYGEENKGSEGIDDMLDDLQFTLLDVFVKAKKPVLGICRGIQVINVYFGGTLDQDIVTKERHSRDYPVPQSTDKVHLVHANNGSWLAHLYDATFSTNSSHHQAAGRIGGNLIVDARCADDGVVEAVHHETLPVWAVQFHPERMSFLNLREDTVDGAAIFNFFIRKAEEATGRKD